MRVGFVTGFGLILALFASIAVGAVAYATGGEIFNPGPLNSVPAEVPLFGVYSHADLACSACHTPFWGSEYMGDRCLECHGDIRSEMTEPSSLHGELAQPSNCHTCHSEHRGPQGQLTDYDADLYPHAEFGFYLIAHRSLADGQPFQCADCHTQSLKTFELETCGSCHLELAPTFFTSHLLEFGTGCLGCHDGIDTYGSRFSHQTTAFPLIGAHLELQCSNCHAGAVSLEDLQGASLDCIDCHAKDDSHAGLLGDDCSACHTPENWNATEFDHALTSFPLVGQHSLLECGDCHTERSWEQVSQSCINCHAKDDAHEGQLGTDCVVCHTAYDWNQVSVEDFDHGLTRYPLTGAHAAQVACEACHIDGQFKGTPVECAACHRTDDAHHGQYGPDCASCHFTSTWKEATFDHNKTGFKLRGAHISLPCSMCHHDGQFQGTPTDCFGCHRSDDAHKGQYGKECDACHSTGNWQDATFDHGQTAFPLTGKHKNLTCVSCHTNGQYAGTPKACVACHADPPYHAGLFGTGCKACHSTNAWEPATYNRSHSFPMRHGNARGNCSSCHTNPLPGFSCAKCHDPQRMANEHAEEGITNLRNCLACHPDGKED